jgi:hypothetical protein
MKGIILGSERIRLGSRRELRVVPTEFCGFAWGFFLMPGSELTQRAMQI